MKISEHISLNEAIKSQTATRKGIDNTPDERQLGNMQRVANDCFEPLRRAKNIPIGISSFFRCPTLNKAIGGSEISQHCATEDSKGINAAAIDIDADIYGGITNKEVFTWLKANVEFDQLIWEFGTDENPNWVHISRREHSNRNQILRAIRKNGRVSYELL